MLKTMQMVSFGFRVNVIAIDFFFAKAFCIDFVSFILLFCLSDTVENVAINDLAGESVASANAIEEQNEAGSIAPKNEVKMENTESVGNNIEKEEEKIIVINSDDDDDDDDVIFVGMEKLTVDVKEDADTKIEP